MIEVECPECGETCDTREIEKRRGDDDLPMPVARRQTAFDGSISSLTEMGNFAYVAVLPCGHEVLTVN